MKHLSGALGCGLLLAFCTLAFSSGCSPDDVGLPCTVEGAANDAGGGATKFNTQALDCRSRLCIFFGGGAEARAMGPLCTEVCEEDGDCPDSTAKCSRGFQCVVGTTVGATRCCRVCVCRSLVSPADLVLKEACRNVSPDCPSAL